MRTSRAQLPCRASPPVLPQETRTHNHTQVEKLGLLSKAEVSAGKGDKVGSTVTHKLCQAQPRSFTFSFPFRPPASP